MKSKQNKFKKLLREKGIDGAIVSSPENVHYILGFGGHQHTVSRQAGFTLAVMSSDEKIKTHGITMDFEYPTFVKKNEDNTHIIKQYTTWVGVRQWSDLLKGTVPEEPKFVNSFEVMLESIKEMDLENKVIGLELDYLPINYYNQLKEKLPLAEFKNISDLFIFSRSVKTEEEIEIFRTICKVADNGFYEVSKIVGIGTTEKEMSQCFKEYVIKSGVCVPSSWSMFSTGPNGARLTIPEDGVIEKGHVVKYDAGVNAAFDFYTTDTSRAWVMEGAEKELYKLKDRLYEAQRKMIELAKPGIPIKELFNTGFNYVKEKYPAYKRGHLGHSISMGPQTAEEPYINSTENRLLEPGMILAMEVPCYIDNFNGFNIEDMVLITETGAEVLTPKTPHYI
ncbi:M24 family metallopeptidase [Miniphocaeibacter halophilus]|uniref:Aminopeptidase P family protein n=1 Tax=Miniphocaeibacter halophilus TaxID=2931922 RepID=A0AC61MMC2_9FIRM|nr:Xaa-Pro peptidase family protein [Miniphocaeibacter halophilus]QQK06879.1 aminopeptidase P family protein [Miniphocaeibacter halophilus]